MKFLDDAVLEIYQDQTLQWPREDFNCKPLGGLGNSCCMQDVGNLTLFNLRKTSPFSAQIGKFLIAQKMQQTYF